MVSVRKNYSLMVSAVPCILLCMAREFGGEIGIKSAPTKKRARKKDRQIGMLCTYRLMIPSNFLSPAHPKTQSVVKKIGGKTIHI